MAKLKPDSVLVTAGRPEAPGDPLNTPLVPASNFILGNEVGYVREHGTPTWTAFESVLGALEGGQGLAFASGMGAVAAVFDLVPQGGKVIIPDDAYQGVASLAQAGAATGRWRLARLPTDDAGAWIRQLPEADLCWVETPSNPMLRLADLEAIGTAPRKAGSLLVVDNTFATPLNQRPIDHGADIVMHSVTKYLGGHSDLLAGALVVRDPDLAEGLMHGRTLQGAIPGSLEMFLATRGLRTLAVRLERAQANAQELAEWLEAHPAVNAVHYPGLESHAQHALARRQLKGFGAIVSFEVRGDASVADRVCREIQLIRHATSLGSVETTMERRAVHAGQEHVPASLLRVSVGIEAAEDLWDDLDQALRAASSA